MKPTLQNVKKLAGSHDAMVEYVDDPGSEFHAVPAHRIIWIDLPPGKHWSANDSSMILRQSRDLQSLPELYAELIDEMQQGVGDCPNGTCGECE